MRMSSGSATGKATLRVTSGSGTAYYGVTASINSSGWTRVSGTVNVTWSGTLTEATFYAETTSGTTNLYADDCSVNKGGLGKPSAEEETAEAQAPEGFALHQNYPNPFNPRTTISYGLGEAVRVRLEVYDLRGRPVAELVNGIQQAGEYSIDLDLSGMPSGLYVCRLSAGSFTAIRKMMFSK